MSAYIEVGFCNIKGSCRFSTAKICFAQNVTRKNHWTRFTFRAHQSEAVEHEKRFFSLPRPTSEDSVRLFVGLPQDAVSLGRNTINKTRAIVVGLKALKLLGVEGVELPIWWGIVEKDVMGKYDWSRYLAIAEMVQILGLRLHVTLCFHGSKAPNIPLPRWVSQIGESQPNNIFFTDRAGHHYKECLSLAVDHLPVLHGKTPVQVYHSFFESFKLSFSSFLSSTITGITIGLGPNGELRYPSHNQLPSNHKTKGVGEFQCYDQNMLNFLKKHADESGNPLWGLGGPHDAPTYDQSPNSNSFFKDGGSWESAYGDFFLSWYAEQLITHGESLLSLATSTFSDTGVHVYGKIPLEHCWYMTHSHPSELTAGFYNTIKRDGYEPVVKMFASNSCKMLLPGLDKSAACQPHEPLSSPEMLLEQIMETCRIHGVKVSGQNTSESGALGGFEQIKKILCADNVLDLFIYQRMGACFFSPKHFPSFTQFVRSLNPKELHSGDEKEVADSPTKNPESSVGLWPKPCLSSNGPMVLLSKVLNPYKYNSCDAEP
ncbi:unnamed protein product [Sphenostylis stenocarpa]|uniref:Beta-amylase n=1 Tax=Sphenostylis stenocarpa TaxID=92480 RepID=A0AA86S411_9FABA|nr:unnamed protein product [Sphenostylis stenocarpa]